MVNKGRKLFCKNCEGKWYTLGKTKNLSCPICDTEYNLEEELENFIGVSNNNIQKQKSENKDEIVDIENTDNTSEDDDIISLDDAAIEEEVAEKN